jgi:hypothetical protein
VSQPKSNKRDRERVKREKATAKAERRLQRREEAGDAAPDAPADQQALVAELARLHLQLEAEEIDLDEFLERRADITNRLVIPGS